MVKHNSRRAFRLRTRRALIAVCTIVGTAVALTVVAVTSASATGAVGTASGFEDDDGNLVADTTFDWNSFSPVTWTGTAPLRVASKTVSGWQFKGLEDAQATTSDSAFAGGVKQDDNCASVGTGKAANKDDLKRIYLSSQTVTGHVYLNLAWVRIPQNTTSPSAHVAFEFNKGTTACGAGHGGLVQRSVGDMLIVYDFEGGSGTPTLTLRRWVTSGACEISSDSPPCWGTATDLTAGGFAEAKVNTTATALDTAAPSSETLGLSEFGEAGIDLTAAGVFTAGQCATFGKALGVSRSSGNSGTAQMKDLVGPGDFSLTNCGSIHVTKVTVPSGSSQSFGYTTTGGLSPSTFNLTDGQTQDYADLQPGTYTVTEGSTTGWTLTGLTCNNSGGTPSLGTATASFSVTAGSNTTCTFTNTEQLGAIKITKTDSKSGDGLAGATFSITGPNSYSNSVQSGADGTVCVGGLPFGSYTVTETAAPNGYAIDDSTGQAATVNANASCSDATYVGASVSLSDTPLSDIQVRFRDGGSGTTSATISCDNATGTTSTTGTTGWDTTTTVTGIKAPTTIHCTIDIDP